MSDLLGGLAGAVGNIEHAYLCVYDTGVRRDIQEEEAERLDAKKPLLKIELPVDVAAVAEQLNAKLQYGMQTAKAAACLLDALFPLNAVDRVKAAEGVAVKRIKVQFNPTQVRVNAVGSKLGLISDLTASKKEEGKSDNYGYQEIPPRITVNIPIFIDEEDNTSAFSSDSVNVLNASNLAQNALNFFTDSKCKVQEETEAILSLLRNSHTRYIGFFWGTKMCYIGSIISAQATYTMFHRDGSPCRSRINLQILTVENSIPAGFRNQWVDKYMAFRETDKNRLVRWGENGIAGNFVNIPF
ncbi:hypothetical protein SAMN05216351_101320 [Pseudobutyrivibrio sp. JW11]|uniref:CIS tube protein n=1 Tax=Pseudobutyrivibrio sp. JW11 TaxID=1855302 RepID=UPI0008EB1456|nr:hypothetical protein [Pseudobutyrivibrio sp. JW11]SFN83590.1 hypothetical protein SAMN05216351_101320 [Pseudobutyrivibrio sp. JW11]